MKYHLARGESQLGTFSDLEVSSGLRDGRFLPSDLCWTDGMPEWQTLAVRMTGLAKDIGEEVATPAAAVAALREEVRRDRVSHPDLAPASLGQRLAAAAVDFLLLVGPLLAMFAMVIDEKFKAEVAPIQQDAQAVADLLQRRLTEMSTAGNPVLELISWIFLAVVITHVVLLTVRGQSIGKLLLGIQIVRNADDARPGFLKAVLLRGLLFLIVGNLRVIGMIFMLVDVLMIFRQDRRCLHDLVADTKVVRRPVPALR